MISPSCVEHPRAVFPGNLDSWRAQKKFFSTIACSCIRQIFIEISGQVSSVSVLWFSGCYYIIISRIISVRKGRRSSPQKLTLFSQEILCRFRSTRFPIDNENVLESVTNAHLNFNFCLLKTGKTAWHKLLSLWISYRVFLFLFFLPRKH